ncbi:relaxase/mobilization nuclease domain-containing protein [Pedobacter jeongneungensis]|uniref:relaxase/mobilization nuclease domain-containing protein n=1 Tax=Pedobacter jeongneungensis TaxID=947309 RepID=UPI000A9A5937|nr:relaxase/mobilization nuclease domain-containing protein [Pedobacter jeongneungensis]
MSGKNIRGILIYNETKVEEGQATLFMASGFAGEVSGMNLAQKNQRFLKRTMLNPSVKTNALHITLNFHSTDKLDADKLQGVVSDYMEQIGFGDQPYLVYLHEDTHHPHVHIATTNIQADGKRIDIHGIAYKLSEGARKSLEQKYRLVVAQEGKQEQGVTLRPAVYGESPTRKTIANLVTAVMRQYRYGSFAEFNAVLKSYNLVADRGAEDSRMFENKGLIYSMLDESGQRIGIPIKASAISAKPTLIKLEKRFGLKKEKTHQAALRKKIDALLDRQHSITKKGFVSTLKKQQVDVTFHHNAHGRVYGLTFIDHNTKTVFNGSELGKGYSAAAVTRQFETENSLVKQRALVPEQQIKTYDVAVTESQEDLTLPKTISYLDMVLSDSDQGYMRPSVKKKRKKKKQQNL